MLFIPGDAGDISSGLSSLAARRSTEEREHGENHNKKWPTPLLGKADFTTLMGCYVATEAYLDGLWQFLAAFCNAMD